jgi:hypothetical protein
MQSSNLPKVWRLKTIKSVVIFHSQKMIVDGKQIAMACQQMSQM